MEELTKYLAIWGAVISTIAFVWNIRNSLVDRGALRLFGERTFLTRRFLEESEEKLHKAILCKLKPDEDKADRFKFYAFNIGKRPLIVSDVRILYKGLDSIPPEMREKTKEERSMTMKSHFPLKIDAGDFSEFDYSWRVINDDFHGVLLCSAEGKKYYLPKKNVAVLKENHKKPMRIRVIGKNGSNKSMQPTADASAD